MPAVTTLCRFQRGVVEVVGLSVVLCAKVVGAISSDDFLVQLSMVNAPMMYVVL